MSQLPRFCLVPVVLALFVCACDDDDPLESPPIEDRSAPKVHARRSAEYIVARGDSLRFWIIAEDVESPLVSMGYELSGALTGTDSVSAVFAATDSVHFAVHVPAHAPPASAVEVRGFATDDDGNRGVQDPVRPTRFELEGRIVLSEGMLFDRPGSVPHAVLDEARKRVYLMNRSRDRVDVYSMIDHTFTTVDVEEFPTSMSLTVDEDRLLVVNNRSRSITVIDITQATPVVDATLAFAGTNQLCEAPFGVASLANGETLLTIGSSGSFCHVWMIDLGTGEATPRDEWGTIRSGPARIITSGDRRFALIGGDGTSGGPVWLYDTNTGHRDQHELSQFVTYMTSNRDGSRFIVNDDLYDGSLQNLSKPLGTDFEVGAFSRNGGEIVVGTDSGYVGIFDVSSAERIETVFARPENWQQHVYIRWLAMTADEDRLFVVVQPVGDVDLYWLWDIPLAAS